MFTLIEDLGSPAGDRLDFVSVDSPSFQPMNWVGLPRLGGVACPKIGPAVPSM